MSDHSPASSGHYEVAVATELTQLRARVAELEQRLAAGSPMTGRGTSGNTVNVPAPFRPLFDAAQAAVGEYFSHLKLNPAQGTIEINEQRYVLVRASALSKDFLTTVQSLYADRGSTEAMSIGKNFLFDIAHVIGINDARTFHQNMGLTDPVAKLSAGPVHFAYTGWAFVDILPESNPTPDDNFYLFYNHPYSFEADSWLRSGARADTTVCIMNAGYSSGWCEESFGIPLTSVEVSCRGRGDANCTFIMSPPHKIDEHLQRFRAEHPEKFSTGVAAGIPTFFERKKVEEELQRTRLIAEESAKAKSDFIANMSHELRTPLGAILGFTELLQKTDLTLVQRDYLEAIHTSGDSLLSIINDILDLSKLDAGKFAIESIPFSVPELLHSVEVMFAAKAAAKGLQLLCSTDTRIRSYVLGDPMRLTQILTNLIGNAIKFTEQGSVRVNCSLRREEDGVLQLCFTTTDTGIGIPADKAEHIFERFTQADTDITRRYGGTGLGLAITKQLVELQGGTVTVESSGGGTTFQVLLAYPKAQEAKSRTERGAHSYHFDDGRRILVVEDNYMNQKLTEIILRNNGFETTIAENGAAAVELLRDEKFDLILMDIQMPVMDGYKATCAIRDDLHDFTPIIAMTAHALDGEREACIYGGMNDYISKPFKEEDLLEKMSYWLSSRDNRAQKSPERIVDLQFLREQTRNNKKFIVEMIRFFGEHNPKDIDGLERAIAARDFEGVYKSAHRIRNTIGFFGLNAVVGSQLLRLEQLARAEEGLGEIDLLFGEIKPLFAQAVRELADLQLSELN